MADSHKGEITNSAFFDESAFVCSFGDFDGGWGDGDVDELPPFGRHAGRQLVNRRVENVHALIRKKKGE